LAGDSILQINGTATDTLSHMDAQNAIKQSGGRLQLRMKYVNYCYLSNDAMHAMLWRLFADYKYFY